MKKIALFLTTLVILYANDKFEEARRLESEGKIKEAMEIYKKIAAKSIENERNLTNALASESSLEINQSNEKRKTNNKSAVTTNDDIDISNALDIRLYDLNYILPASVAVKNIEGRKRFETKFQISLQKPLTYDLFGLNESIIAAYSQTSWWQTTQSSAPFRETNYRPELFVSFPTYFNALPQLKTLNFGILHDSNGQGGEKSRSWNRLYAKGEFNFAGIIILPRIWGRISDKNDDNPHINRYMGNADINVIAPLEKHFLRLMLRSNLHLDDTNKGAVEVGWLFPLGSSGIYGYLQYFNGYGESLIDYKRHMQKISIGISVLK